MPAILRVALLASLSPTLVSAIGPQVYTVPDDNRIVLVDCDNSRGSAFRVGPHHYISVRHVTANEGCRVNGKPIHVVRSSGAQDFSIFTMDEDQPGFFRIDCSGFKAGEEYVAVGFARGAPFLTAVELTAIGEYTEEKGFALLKGMATVIPGQSGGPILLKRTMQPVGTTNIYYAPAGISGSRELRGTEVCRAGKGDGLAPPAAPLH